MIREFFYMGLLDDDPRWLRRIAAFGVMCWLVAVACLLIAIVWLAAQVLL